MLLGVAKGTKSNSNFIIIEVSFKKTIEVSLTGSATVIFFPKLWNSLK